MQHKDLKDTFYILCTHCSGCSLLYYVCVKCTLCNRQIELWTGSNQVLRLLGNKEMRKFTKNCPAHLLDSMPHTVLAFYLFQEESQKSVMIETDSQTRNKIYFFTFSQARRQQGEMSFYS